MRCAILLAALVAFAAAWQQQGPAPSDMPMKLMIAVKQTNVEWLRDTLRKVSDPDSPSYGEYMTFEEQAKHVHGVPENVAAITAMLDAAGLAYTRQHDDSYIFASGPAAIVAAVMECEPMLWTHAQRNLSVARCASPTVPAPLAVHTDFVIGHHRLPNERRVNVLRQARNESGLLGTTPESIDKAYKLDGATATNKKNLQAIASFLRQYFSREDLQTFQKKFNVPVRPIAKVEGVNLDAAPGVEADLDVQYITSTGRGVPTYFISTSQEVNHGQEDFLTWMSGQLNDTSSPLVHSVSYGDDEASIPADYKTRVNDDFMKFGVSGRTILVAAGDSGVTCKGDKFNPDWPTSSPYITAVGGSTSTPEVAWSFGGGGFSNFYPAEDWQKPAISTYLNSGKAPASSYFNTSGRAYPDVAAYATDFEIVFHGGTTGVAGTSCATPTFAGVVSQLNDVLLNSNKPSLGFMNPFLYKTGLSTPTAFNDITSGANSGGAGCPGFTATTGWDPATGWGSPDFSVLKTVV